MNRWILFLVGAFIFGYGVYKINIHFLIVGGVFVLMSSFSRNCQVNEEGVEMDYQSFLAFHRYKYMYFKDMISVFKRPWEKDPRYAMVYFETEELTIRLMFDKEIVDEMLDDIVEHNPHIENRSFVFEDEFEEIEKAAVARAERKAEKKKPIWAKKKKKS